MLVLYYIENGGLYDIKHNYHGISWVSTLPSDVMGTWINYSWAAT